MIKSFLLLTLLLITMIVFISLHDYTFTRKRSLQRLQALTELTHNAQLSLSVAYDEAQYNPTYPEMAHLKRMDFIYEQ